MKLEITPQEREELLRLVKSTFEETRVEARHSQNRDFRHAVQHEEDVLRGLILKLEDLNDTGISAVA